MKEVKIGWAYSMGGGRNAFKYLVRNSEVRRPLENLDVDGRLILK
jgi:hypothetical protein